MKNILLPACIIMLMWSCNPSQHTLRSSDAKVAISDSLEYELVITDPDFDLWYLMNFSSSKDYSNEFYRGKNQFAVSSWNEYFRRGKYSRIIENHIFYDNSVDYGIEVNRKLYWYFKYTEEKFRIRLLS